MCPHLWSANDMASGAKRNCFSWFSFGDEMVYQAAILLEMHSHWYLSQQQLLFKSTSEAQDLGLRWSPKSMVCRTPKASSRDIHPTNSHSHEASLTYRGTLDVHEEIQNDQDGEWKDSGKPWSPKWCRKVVEIHCVMEWMCVSSSKVICWSPIPQYDYIWRWSLQRSN